LIKTQVWKNKSVNRRRDEKERERKDLGDKKACSYKHRPMRRHRSSKLERRWKKECIEMALFAPDYEDDFDYEAAEPVMSWDDLSYFTDLTEDYYPRCCSCCCSVWSTSSEESVDLMDHSSFNVSEERAEREACQGPSRNRLGKTRVRTNKSKNQRRAEKAREGKRENDKKALEYRQRSKRRVQSRKLERRWKKEYIEETSRQHITSSRRLGLRNCGDCFALKQGELLGNSDR